MSSWHEIHFRGKSKLNCIHCNKDFFVNYSRSKIAKFCSKECHNQNLTGRKLPKETRSKMTESLKKRWSNGFKLPPKVLTEEGKKSFHEKMSGKNNPLWKGGSKSRTRHSLHNPEYVKWRSSIFKRDNWKCRIADSDCLGQLEAHHILRWAEFPELRYQLSNGITLCHAHHPRKRAEEKRLASRFQELVSVSKESYSIVCQSLCS